MPTTDTGFTVRGARQLDRAMAELGSRTASRKIGRAAVRAGSRPVIVAARANLAGHRRTGALRKSLGLKIAVYSGKVLSIIGARSKPGSDGRNPARRAHLIEFGTSAHEVNGRQHPGHPAFPFLRPAFDSQLRASLAAMRTKAWETLEEAARKARRR